MLDKKAAIREALEEHGEWSDRKIAQLLGVSHTYVANVRKELGMQGIGVTGATGRGIGGTGRGTGGTGGAGARAPDAQARKSYGAPVLPLGYGKADILTLAELLIERLGNYYEDTTTGEPDPVVAVMNKLVRFARNAGLYAEEDDAFFGMIESGVTWHCSNCETPVLPGAKCSKCGADTKMYPPTQSGGYTG